jgi:diguanylate cyclase (GGDEF)-like protein/PAS domain S-box-containing protein
MFVESRPFSFGVSDRPDLRLRLAMQTAILVISTLLAAAGWTIWQGESQRLKDAELLNLAGLLRSNLLRVATDLDLPGENATRQAAVAIVRSRRNAERVEALLGAQVNEKAENLPARLQFAIERARNSREQLLQLAEMAIRVNPAVAIDDAVRVGLVNQVRGQAEMTFLVADSLVVEVQSYVEEKSAAAMWKLVVIAALTALVIIALWLGIVEPAARVLKRQHVHLSQQIEEGKRLALVARLTNNVVVITDVDRRIVWVNEAFTRICGYTLEEAIGQKPAELLRSNTNDPATMAKLRDAMDTGQSVRVELLARSKQGLDFWLDTDIQPLHDDSGGLSGFVTVATDTTQQVFQRERLRAVLNTLPAGVVEYDAKSGAIVDANGAAEQVLGLERSEMLGRYSIDTAASSVRGDLTPFPVSQHPLQRSMRDGESVRGEVVGIATSSGTLRWLVMNSAPLRGPQGAVTGAVACFVDVTEQREQQLLLQLALKAARIGTWQWRIEIGDYDWSEASCQMLGFDVAEFAPHLQSWKERIHPADRQQHDRLLHAHLRDSRTPYSCDIRMQHREGHWVWIQVFGEVLERNATAQVQRMVGIHVDISERKQHEAQLTASALSDALTGLPNRANVLNRLEGLIAAKQKYPNRHFGLLFLDFDRFKHVNDSLGHAAGDELLRQISERLKGTLRPSDAIARDGGEQSQLAARLGGDEFVVLLGAMQKPMDACLVADRLLKTLERPYLIDGHVVHSTASIGIVHSDLSFVDASSLLRDADTAMYEAKQTGRARWVLFEPSMHDKVTLRAGLEADLHSALEREELFVVYQPVVSLDDTQGSAGCTGVEALVRWSHPQRGVVPPVQFIPVAEDCGLIAQLGQFVLSKACQQFMQWKETLGLRAPGLLAVNLSIAQLREPDFLKTVQATLAATGMPAGCLQLEVTESLAAQDPAAQKRLRELKVLGIKLALDDFGTGYSSLACLHQLPVDTVKVDRSFIAEAEHSEYHVALMEATVRVARTLRMTTVAEGIETASQSALVQRLGCDRGQGYYFSKPLLAAHLAEWVSSRMPAAGEVVVQLSQRRGSVGD